MTDTKSSDRHHPGLSGMILCLVALTALSGCAIKPATQEAAVARDRERGESSSDGGGMGY